MNIRSARRAPCATVASMLARRAGGGAMNPRLVAAFCVGVGLLVVDVALAQRAATVTTVTSPDPAAELARLRKALDVLQARVTELEKEEVDQFEGPDVGERDADRVAALEKRLAALEREPSGGRGSDARPGADADDESLTVREPFVVLDKSGRTIFRVETSEEGRPLVVVGNGLRDSIVLGTMPDTGAASIRLFDAGRKATVQLVAAANGGELLVNTKDATPVVRVNVDKSGAGAVKVSGPGGSAGAGLLADAAGGRVVVASAKSGQTTASMSNSPEGGRVGVFASSGGTPRATVVAEGAAGSFNVFRPDAQAAAVLMAGEQSAAGTLRLWNAAGDTAVEAGSLAESGAGIVRTGPAGTGPAGVVGGTLRQASSIQGRGN